MGAFPLILGGIGTVSAATTYTDNGSAHRVRHPMLKYLVQYVQEVDSLRF